MKGALSHVHHRPRLHPLRHWSRGIGTGLAGLSAALIIAPALMTFCDMPAYEAVTIALASDVLASAISAWTYAKRKNLDVKNGVVLLLSILVFTLVGSYIGQFAPNTIVKYFAIFMVCTIGLKFIIWPVMTSKTEMANTPFAQRAVKSIFFGAIIGFICGFVGVGGGAMMLLVLTLVLGFELKTAIGTSVFIMSFTALFGAVSHFALGAKPTCGLCSSASPPPSSQRRSPPSLPTTPP